MEFWEQMSPQMYLKSSWSALNISDPRRAYSLPRYAQAVGMEKQEPVALQTFLAYGHWFQEHVVPEVDATYVTHVTRDGQGFHLELADGRELQARTVTLATGVAPFANIPEVVAHLPAELVTHSQQHREHSAFRDKQMVVVGSGQSALESAALLHEAGAASVEVIARGPINWIDRRLYYYTGPIKRIFYPPSDVGPPGVNWLVAYPLLFRLFPDRARAALDQRAVRPSGSRWLRPRVEGKVALTPHTSIQQASEQGGRVHLRLSDGSTREVDHIVLGTGYRTDIQKLTYLDTELREQIKHYQGNPLLNGWFESSVPNLHFVGASANYNFGPLCRFVVGAQVAAQQVAKHARLVA
jgi:cation diffusion facilitator CzcD-associated flavoprotein CzcO